MVATAMTRTIGSLSNMPENSRFAPDPITYTRAAVATIGIQHTTYGYFYHALQVRISVSMVTDPLGQILSLCVFIVHCRGDVSVFFSISFPSLAVWQSGRAI